MAFPFFGGRKVLGSSDPRAMYAGCYRYPNGSHGAEIRIGDTRPKVIGGGNSAGKGAGIIIPNLLKRTGISQVTVDTRCQAAAVAAPWRSTIDEKTAVSNAYGCLAQLPEYADLQGGAGINLLEAPELDPDHPLVTDHLAVMASTTLPAENDHQPFFPTASQSLFISFCYGELVEAKREGRKPLLANVRRKVLERSTYDAKTGEPVAGMAWHARQIVALGHPFINSCIDRFAGKATDEMRAVIATFEIEDPVHGLPNARGRRTARRPGFRRGRPAGLLLLPGGPRGTCRRVLGLVPPGDLGRDAPIVCPAPGPGDLLARRILRSETYSAGRSDRRRCRKQNRDRHRGAEPDPT